MTDERHPLRPSLFPNGAPYLRVLEAGLSHHPPLPSELSLVSVAAPSGISPIVEESVREAGLSLLTSRDKTDPSTVTCRWETLPVTEKGKDEINFSSLRADQKINQFPGLFVIGRKDLLWTSYHHMLQVIQSQPRLESDRSPPRDTERNTFTSWPDATCCLRRRRSVSEP